MRQTSRTFIATLLVAGLASTAVHAQKGDPANAARLASLKDVMKDRKMEKDAQGVQLLGEIGASYDKLNKADRKKAVKAVGAVFSTGKLRSPEKAQIYTAAAAALAKMEKPGAKTLQKIYDSKRIPNKKPWAFMRADLVRRIGDTKDAGMIKFLCDRVSRSSFDEELVAAGATLGNYADLDQKKRNPIVKAMIGKLGALESAASMTVLRADTPQQLGTLNAQETLRKIRDPWNNTLRRLTDHRFDTGHDWQRWYNKNKNKKWK